MIEKNPSSFSSESKRANEPEVHAHVHVHADGTVHNHLHAHQGGGDCDLVESHDVSCGLPPVHMHSFDAQGHVALRASGLSYCYPRSKKTVFGNIGLEAEAGKVLAILGNNGAGKSTLLNLLAGIERPCAGSVRVADRDLAHMNRREIARHIAYVAQQQRIPHLSVYDQVLLGRRPHVSWSLSDYDRNVVAHTIDQLGLGAFAARYLDELSGGERQKVYIARALAQEPEVLLLDEPTSALDPKNQIEVLQVIRQVTQEESIATILVIHDINLALRFCDRFLLVRDGEVIAQGDRSVASGEVLSETYGIPFRVDQVAGIPVAIPLA